MLTTENHLIFRIKDQLFTLNVSHVRTIIQMPRLFAVPQAPDYILGIINLEGDVIPVVDAAKKIKMGTVELVHQSQVIIMQRSLEFSDKQHQLGFLVDEVCDVSELDPRKIQALPVSKFEFDHRLVDGMHKIGEEFCMQINVGNFFKGETEQLLEGALAR
ncbi:chemotaxis protein CheW [Chryseolinea sp. T2]|uniref:chemotaxis protein CheW n=1 Tax=Chryseolinea sp. T2 TaxID=3129255 RepID=UPI0030771525